MVTDLPCELSVNFGFLLLISNNLQWRQSISHQKHTRMGSMSRMVSFLRATRGSKMLWGVPFIAIYFDFRWLIIHQVGWLIRDRPYPRSGKVHGADFPQFQGFGWGTERSGEWYLQTNTFQHRRSEHPKFGAWRGALGRLLIFSLLNGRICTSLLRSQRVSNRQQPPITNVELGNVFFAGEAASVTHSKIKPEI